MDRDRILPALLIAVACVTYAAALGLRPLLVPDEFRYAEIPREMVESGDWVVPKLDGVVYFEKPVLGYWATAVSLIAFGDNAWGVRLPFALATLATAAITAALARRKGGGRPVAAFAAAVLLTSVGSVAIGTAAVLDPLFSAAVTATLAAFFEATERPPGAARRAWLAASGVACGAAFLTKGLLALAIPAVVAGPYLVVSGRARELLRLPWIPLCVALVTIAPWSIAIAVAEPAFWPRFVLIEHLQRFAGGARADHAAPFWFYLPVLLVGTLPWTSLAIPVVGNVRRLAREPLARFALCWLIGPVVLLSLSSGKLPTYVLPCLPPVVLLFAAASESLPLQRLQSHLARISLGIVAVCAAALAVLLLSLLTGFPGLDPLYDPREAWKLPVAACALLVAILPPALTRRAPSTSRRVAGIVASVLVLSTAVSFAFPAWQGTKTPQRWLEERLRDVGPDAIVVSDHSVLYAVCWQLRRSDVWVAGSGGELAYGLARSDQPRRALSPQELEGMIRDPGRTRPVVVVHRRDRKLLPGDLAPTRSQTWKNLTFQRFEAPGIPSDPT